jgi:hypothetical protein
MGDSTEKIKCCGCQTDFVRIRERHKAEEEQDIRLSEYQFALRLK